MAKQRLSASMVKVLENLTNGLRAGDHCRGQSQFGGVSGTIYALRRRGLIGETPRTRELRITLRGRTALKQAKGDT